MKRLDLAGVPVWVSAEQAIDEADLIADKQAERETDNTGAGNECAIQPGKAIPGERERKGNHARNQHHAGDRPDTKDEEVQDGPFGLANCAQDQ